jgi:hypothetical protein
MDKALQTIDTSPGNLVAMAIEKGTDVDKLDKLFDLYKKWEADQAKKAFFVALSKFQKECDEIKKTKSGWNNNYRFAPFEDIINQVKSKMNECGFSYTFNQEEKESKIIVTCNLHHIDGHTKSMSLSGDLDKSGGKNSIQATGSTVTYLKRYTFLGITGITTADQDDDAERVSTGLGALYEQVVKLLDHSKVKGMKDYKKAKDSIPDKKYLEYVRNWCNDIINAKPQKQTEDNPVEKKRKAVLTAIEGMQKGEGKNFLLTQAEVNLYIDNIKAADTIEKIIEIHEDLIKAQFDRVKNKNLKELNKPCELDLY